MNPNIRSRIDCALKCASAIVLLSVTSAVVLAQGGPGAEPEDPMLQRTAVAQYVRKHRVEPAEAQYRIELQDRAGGIDDDLVALLKSNYAGIWFDAADRGRLKIGMTQEAAAQSTEVRLILERYGLDHEADLVDAQYSEATLLSAQAAVGSSLRAMIEGGRAKTGLDFRVNRAIVIALARLSAEEEALIARVGGSPAVQLRRIDVPSLTGQFHSCNITYCDPPFRGGREIGEFDPGSIYVCTAAFMAQDHVYPYHFHAITAGHCIFFGGASSWRSKDETGTYRTLSSSNAYYSFAGANGRDAGRIGISDSGFWIPPNPAARVVVKASASTSYNPNYAIHKTSGSTLGQMMCRTGRTTGTECGEVDLLYADETAWGSDGLIYSVSNMVEIDVCGAKSGDSGGPMYKNHRAYGIYSGEVDFGPAFCFEWYQGIRGAETALKVSVVLAN